MLEEKLVKDLTVASKATLGVKSGHENITSAAIVTDNDVLLCIIGGSKGKFTSVKDFSVDNRGNKGQTVAENTTSITAFENGRTNVYVIPKMGKVTLVDSKKLSIKGKAASGASLSNKVIVKTV